MKRGLMEINAIGSCCDSSASPTQNNNNRITKDVSNKNICVREGFRLRLTRKKRQKEKLSCCDDNNIIDNEQSIFDLLSSSLAQRDTDIHTHTHSHTHSASEDTPKKKKKKKKKN
eukprot:GHVR01030320.1.p1 GENE.GHVR01030320.1~~GHVR01030320.1.p1  ORF type:complete len:115 (+),score=51.99 GHVR01030320.1:36-380(+)